MRRGIQFTLRFNGQDRSSYAKVKFLLTCCPMYLQELEIQARAHGLPNMPPPALGQVELSSHLQSQPALPMHQEGSSGEYAQSTVSAATAAFSDPLTHFTDFFGATLKEEQRLEHILMDGPLSPFGADPLLSSTSPAASKGSSRRSSFSTDEGEGQ